MKTEVFEKAGKRVVLLGNEAIARGVLEAGAGVVTAYPGTPTSEVPIILSSQANNLGYFFEYSTNEKVALETAAGAAWSGVRAFVSMKHFGLNVALDALLPLAYVGVRAALVIMVGDDPGGFSSVQSEQDSRYIGIMAHLPILEPATPEDCLRLTKLAFSISEEYSLPVILRTTTKVSHGVGPVRLGKIGQIKNKGFFKKDPKMFYNFKPSLQELHSRLEDKLSRIEQKYGRSLNKIIPGKGDIGILTSGISFEYGKEAVLKLGINPPFGNFVLSNPLSEAFVASFIKNKRGIVVLEELEPIIEDFVKKVAQKTNPTLQIYGKNFLPKIGGYNIETILPVLEKVFAKKYQLDFGRHKRRAEKAISNLPPRNPVFCPGCPHRSTFYAVKRIFPKAVYAGDIGCYMLGVYEPFKMEDFIICMGSGTSLAHGISRVSGQDIIAFIGDSTFFHAGMPALLNWSYNNNASPILVILDNGITAMTGHQPHPGSGFTGMGKEVKPIKIEDVVKSFGINVWVVNAFNQEKLVETLERIKKIKGPRVLISKGECRLLTKRKMRSKGIRLPRFEIVNQKEFKKSKLLEEFACPAMGLKNGVYQIDDSCLGCGVCAQICPKAIKPKIEKGKNEI